MSVLACVRNELGFPTQSSFAHALGISQQAISHADRQEQVPDSIKKRILKLLDEKGDYKLRDHISEILARGPRIDSSRDIEDLAGVKKDWDPLPFEPIEREAWPWALGFRNQCQLDRLHSLADQHGFKCRRISDGIELTQRKKQWSKDPLQKALFPATGHFGMKKSGTIIVLGAAYRHYTAREVFEVITQRMELDLRIREFSKRPFYFGYQTVLKYLSINGKFYRPSRYANDDAIYYEDYGVILNSPLKMIVEKGEAPFGKKATRFVLVAGLHRLASGIGMRLIEDSTLRNQIIENTGNPVMNKEYDLESDTQMGALIYRVVVRHDRFWSSVEELKVLAIF